jgi:hypothetical protein
VSNLGRPDSLVVFNVLDLSHRPQLFYRGVGKSTRVSFDQTIIDVGETRNIAVQWILCVDILDDQGVGAEVDAIFEDDDVGIEDVVLGL